MVKTANLSGNALASFSFNVNTSAQPLAPGTHSFSLQHGAETHWATSASMTSTLPPTDLGPFHRYLQEHKLRIT